MENKRKIDAATNEIKAPTSQPQDQELKDADLGQVNGGTILLDQ